MEAPCRVMHLTFTMEDRNGNDITCSIDPSPDSLRTTSSLSHVSTDSPDDVEMAEDCVSEVTSNKNMVLHSDNIAKVVFEKTGNGNCSQNVTLMVSGLQSGTVDSARAERPAAVCGPIVQKNGRGSETRLDSAEQEVFLPGSVELSHCGSDQRCSSVSSGEMVIRSNSFLLHESEPLLSVSLLEDSSDIPSDVGLMPGLLPDVCEGLFNNMVSASGKDTKHQEFGVTFIQPANQTFIMEEEVFQTTSGYLVPQRGNGDSRSSHLVPGIDPSECVTPVNCNKSKTEAQRFQCHKNGSPHSTPAEGRTFQLATSEELDISGNVQTSTPVQSLSSKTFCLPSLSDSSLSKGQGELGSPVAQVIKEQPSSVSQKRKTSLTAPPRCNKSEVKKFAKPDFSNVKSKIASRPNSALKPSSVAVVKVSSNISHQVKKNQATKTPHSMQRKTSPTKSTSAVSSNPTITSTSSSVKKDQSTVSKRVRSTTCQEGAPAPKSRLRTWSEASTSSKAAKEEPAEIEPQVSRTINAFTTAKPSSAVSEQNQTGLAKDADRHAFSGEGKQEDRSLNISGKPQKTTLKTHASRLAEPTPCDWSKGRLGPQPSSSRAGGAPAARAPAANLRQPPSSASKLKPGTAGKNGCASTDMPSPRSKQSASGGNTKMRLSEGTGAEVSGGTHPRLSLNGAHPHNSASKLPVKPRGPLKSASASGGHRKPDYIDPSPGVVGKPPTNRNASVRTRLQSMPPRASSGCKNTSASSQTSVRSSASVLKTPASPRHVRLTGALSVDKGKAKTTSQSQQQGQANGHPDLVPPETKPRGVEYYKALCEKKNQTIQQLKNSFKANNCRFEAITVVVQNLCAEHEGAVKRRQELSLELLNLREELVSSVQSCERLEQEKEDLRAAFDRVLQKVQEQHRSDLADLEERLKTFYSAEWEKVHQTYQEEADKCRAQMEQQLEELRAKHEALKKELEASHGEKVESLKQHYEKSFEELRQSHEQEINTLEKTLKDAETTLSNQIEELTAENSSLSEKLKAEEDWRKELAEKCQKDSHTLYLEQELESLKVVLDIKNKQIHQQDKKLMQMDKLMEKNVKLDECLKKVQQENEDLKARMDRHAALSRQLSTEQAVLQESLQKETKVNKRLSMENEELLWKLQNGDLSSPRKTSPSSPSITLQSPRNSGLFSSPPISPR
ncbi:microtubule-associated tumor suppressor 1 homolog A isoform X1 [Colossoma macropomum]|uniref:microtubule-associated tumor suppressor 1 homolog A isoform X1 n=2 Tax=Colossoma macropomum TaxID=42526 RepID=UPI00186447A5|nr:microtubule-associated tumor suppressor 1 homolog A isoform X1 [Colossoma macropomum]XP_036424565.1 microtubule-associated tumor suppressor 1 homolog A isoform X1 [Colossoma macropomum]